MQEQEHFIYTADAWFTNLRLHIFNYLHSSNTLSV